MLEYKNCHLCPRDCGVNRSKGQLGFCHMSSELMAARAALHMWEEPCISGEEGSGTVFFSGCTLRCVYCQNHNIALGKAGKNLTVERLADIFIELQEKKANNINLVTPTHFVPHIKEALIKAKNNGLKIPIVYNTSGYENIDTLRQLSGLIDIYLPDFKYFSSAPAKKYSAAGDYFEVACLALEEMYKQTGSPQFDDRGMMKKGIIVRHLVLPGFVEESKKIIDYLYHTYKDEIYISIMNQYTPLPMTAAYPELTRKITKKEYDEVVDYAIDLGVVNGFIQEEDTASESFIPEFDNEGI